MLKNYSKSNGNRVKKQQKKNSHPKHFLRLPDRSYRVRGKMALFERSEKEFF